WVRRAKNTSAETFKSPWTRLDAKETNAIDSPSALGRGWIDKRSSGNVPIGIALRQVVCPVNKSRTNTFLSPLTDSLTKLVAWLSNATYRPFPLIAGAVELAFPDPAPRAATLTSVTAP